MVHSFGIEGSYIIIKKNIFLSLKLDFALETVPTLM